MYLYHGTSVLLIILYNNLITGLIYCIMKKYLRFIITAMYLQVIYIPMFCIYYENAFLNIYLYIVL